MVVVDPVAAKNVRLAFDLYAGAGVTTHALRQRYREVVACEAHPESAAQLSNVTINRMDGPPLSGGKKSGEA